MHTSPEAGAIGRKITLRAPQPTDHLQQAKLYRIQEDIKRHKPPKRWTFHRAYVRKALPCPQDQDKEEFLTTSCLDSQQSTSVPHTLSLFHLHTDIYNIYISIL